MGAGVTEPSRDDVPEEPDDSTLLAVLHSFADDGWTENLSVTDDGDIRCPSCDTVTPPADAGLDRLRRLEGVSDPDDMMAVLAITCPSCGARGVVVANYGPNASEGDSLLLQALGDQRPGG